ncbi:MAG TPA: TonB-dependent receptor [Polyangia bacterium]
MRIAVGAAALLLVAGAGVARAQLTQEDAPVTEGVPKFTPPVLRSRVAAPYPPAALAAGLSGTVVLELDVDDKGAVGNVVVRAPAGHGFDEAAVAAVKQFVFAPAMNDRTPVPARVTYAYKFLLKSAPAPRPTSAAATAKLRGGAFVKGTRAPLADGSVIAVSGALQERATIDAGGHFELTLPPGTWHLVVSAPRARRFETDERLVANQALTVTYWIEPSQYTRYETTVRADPDREEISRQTLTTEELVKMPGTMGDALRAIENLPGVARAPFNSGLIIVRGGKPTDSRVFLAGAEVPQLYHFGGFTSVFPTQLVDHVDYFAGNFGVRYGRAIAGAIDVDLREPKRDRFHAALETNLFDTGGMVEGPVGRGSFAIAARRSYVDAIMGALHIPGLQFTTAPVYYDYQGIFDYPLGGGRFRALLSGSDDQLVLSFARPQDADPAISAFGTHIWYHKLQLRWTRTVGHWSFYLQNSTGLQGQSGNLGRSLDFDIFAVGSDTRLEARWTPSSRLRFLFGADQQYGNVDIAANIPPPPQEGQIPGPLSSTPSVHEREKLNVGNLGLYAEATWKPSRRFTITPGLRFDYFSALARQAFNPRLTARVQAAPFTWLKGGVGVFSQDPQAPDYDPNFGNPRLRPESAIHYALTVEQGLLPGLMAEVTGFYKDLYDLVVVSSSFVRRDGGQALPERKSNDGRGRIYGGELLLRQSVSKWFFGWISYTLLRSERKDCASCQWRLFDFDQTHILIIAAHAYLPKGFEVGARFRYITGYPYTVAYGGWYDADVDVYSPAQGPVNTGRLAAFNQLDVRFDKTFLFQRWLLRVYLDITNIYNNANVEVNQPSYDFTRRTALTGLPIIPSFGVRAEF